MGNVPFEPVPVRPWCQPSDIGLGCRFHNERPMGCRVKLHCRITEPNHSHFLAEHLDIEPSRDFAREKRSGTFTALREAQDWCLLQVESELYGGCKVSLQWSGGSPTMTAGLFI